MEQGTRSFMDFLSEVEDQEYLCRIEEQPLTGDDLKRMSLIAGMKDRTLAEKALAEELSLTDLIKSAITREASKANVEAMRAKTSSTVNRVTDRDTDVQKQLDELRTEMDIMRVRHIGKYSRRFKSTEPMAKKGSRNQPCARCNYHHNGRKCPAEGKTCNECGEEGHFARSQYCKTQFKRTSTTRRINEDASDSEDDRDQTQTVSRIDSYWPGVQEGVTRTRDMYYINPQKTEPRRKTKHVPINVGGKEMHLFCDTGSRFTIIPPHIFLLQLFILRTSVSFKS